MVCDPGGDHARFDRVVAEYLPHGGGVTHHGHLPLADKLRWAELTSANSLGGETDGHWNEKADPYQLTATIAKRLVSRPDLLRPFSAASRIASRSSASHRSVPGTVLIAAPHVKIWTPPVAG